MSPPRPKLVASRGRRTQAAVEPGQPVHPFDVEHGTETGGLIPGIELATGSAADRFVTAYYAVAPSILRTLLELWQTRCAPPFPIDRYVFVDVGAGKGRAILVAAENPFEEVVGVELNPRLLAIAQANLQRAQRSPGRSLEQLAPVRAVGGDALTYRLPGAPTVLFLFHPFGAAAMQRLLRSIRAQFTSRPDQIDLLYANAEHIAVLDRDESFRRLWSGRVPMSTEDHLADLKEIETQAEYGSTGDEFCAIYRFIGRQR